MTKIWGDFDSALAALDPNEKYMRVEATEKMGMSSGVFATVVKNNVLFRAYYRPEEKGERVTLYRGSELIAHLERLRDPWNTVRLLAAYRWGEWDYPNSTEYVFREGAYVEPIGGSWPDISAR